MCRNRPARPPAITTPGYGTFETSGGPPPGANHSSYSPAADRRSTRLSHAGTWCRAVINSGLSPRNWVQGNMLSYAESARSPLSEERRQADPPAGLSLFNHTPGTTRENAHAASWQRFRTSPARQLRLRTQRCGALTMCAHSQTPPPPGGGTAAARLGPGETFPSPTPALNRGCAQPPLT